MILAGMGCSHSVEETYFYKDDNGTFHIETEKVLNNPSLRKEEIRLSDLADSIEYIKLGSRSNTEEAAFIRGLNEMHILDHHYLIADYSNVLLFDEAGNLLHQIGHQGNGPYEYLYILGSAVDNENQEIAIVSSNKAVVYSFDNRPVRELPVKEDGLNGISQAAALGHGKILINYPNAIGQLENKLTLIDSLGNILKSYPN